MGMGRRRGGWDGTHRRAAAPMPLDPKRMRIVFVAIGDELLRGESRDIMLVGHYPHLPSLLERDRLFKRAPQQRAVFELLESLGGHATVAHVVDQLKCTTAVIAAPLGWIAL